MGTQIVEQISTTTKMYKEMYECRYDLFVLIFNSIGVENEEPYDYEDFTIEDLKEDAEDRSDSSIYSLVQDMTDKPSIIKILVEDDKTQNISVTEESIRTKIEECKGIFDNNISKLTGTVEDKTDRFKKLYAFRARIVSLSESVTRDRKLILTISQSFLLECIMNIYYWDEEEYNRDIFLEYNVTQLLDKGMDFNINIFSVLNQYDELFKRQNGGEKTPKYEINIQNIIRKKELSMEMINISKLIHTELVNKDVKTFSVFYTDSAGKKSLKDVAEQQLLNVDIGDRKDKDWTSLLESPLILEDSDKVRYIHEHVKPIGTKPKKLEKYFGTGSFGKELQKQYKGEGKKYKNLNFKNRKWGVEHHLYLFFKEILKDMPYKPNPTSNPEHEIEIRGYLLKNGFVGPRPNMDKDTKTKWYEDKSLRIGEFVEQPNGSTSHPDLWVQLSNLRLSVEAKSNQGYYPMYGKTPPPKETVYIFSSKKQKYPNNPFGKDSFKKGRTTFTFGHQILTDPIRDIMKNTKKQIKLEGREMDWNIDATGENYSSVGLTSDVNIQHSGSEANYWLNDRNIEREKQVLSYNWLNPLGKCDDKVDYYMCERVDILGSPGDDMKFKCIRDNKTYTCMCKTHKTDFEKTSAFVNSSFSDMLEKEYMKQRDGKFYENIDNTEEKICYMCLSKYYKSIKKKQYFLDHIKGVMYNNTALYYNVVWKNYPGEDWRTYNQLLGVKEKGVDKIEIGYIQRDLDEQMKTFWINLLKYHPDLKFLSGKNLLQDTPIENEIFLRRIQGEGKMVDMFDDSEDSEYRTEKVVTQVNEYNKKLFDIYHKITEENCIREGYISCEHKKEASIRKSPRTTKET